MKKKGIYKKLDEIMTTASVVSDLSLKTTTEEYMKKLFEGKTLEEIQAMDPVVEWEKATGVESYKQNGELENFSMIGFMVAFNERKKQLLIEAKEIHSGTTYEEFVKAMQELGFKIAFREKFKNPHSKEKEEEIILYEVENGLVIYATSFGEYINSAKLYGELESAGYKYKKGDEEIFPEVKSWADMYYRDVATGRTTKTLAEYVEGYVLADAFPQHSSHGSIKDGTPATFSFDMREGAIAKIMKLKRDHRFAKPVAHWQNKSRFLWFLNQTEDKGDYDYKAITNEKILKCPKEFIDIINDPDRFVKSDTEGV